MFLNFFKQKPSLENFDLTQECKLKFTKNEYNKYEISFFNQIFKEYWTLPSGNCAGIHEKWTLLNHGSFGAYGLYKLTCEFNEIDGWKKSFKTINDIKNHLDYYAKYYDDFQKYLKKCNDLPDVVF